MSRQELTYEKPSDTAALKSFVERLARTYGKGLDPDEALSQAWWRMLRAVDTYEPGHGKAFQSWAIWHVRSGMHLLRRAGARRRGRLAFNTEWVEETGAAPVVETSDPLAWARLESALSQLRPRERQALELTQLYEMPQDEAAEIMGLTRQRVSQLANEALESLRGLLGVEGAGGLFDSERYREKLTPEAVREIRTSAASQKSLAKRYGVAQRTVADVRAGRTWTHVR